MANQPLNQFARKPYQNFDAGLISRPNEDQIPATAFHQLDNAILADRDILEKAPGYELDGSPFPDDPDSFIRMLVNYRAGAAVNSLVVAALDEGNTNASYKVDLKQTPGDGTYHYIGYTVGTATFTNGSAVVTGSGTAWDDNLKAGDKIKPNNRPAWYEIQSVDSATQVTLVSVFAQATSSAAEYMARLILSLNSIPVGLVFNSELLIANGVEAMQEFDNTTLKVLQDSDAPFAALLEKHKSRVFAARAPASPSTLFWCKTNDLTIWDSTSKAPIFPNDGGFIVQIKSFANSILVFKDNGNVYQVVGEFDQDEIGAPAMIRKVDTPDNIGIIAGRSVVINSDNRLYFLAETGIYTIDPNMRVQKISWDIEPDIKNLIFRGSPLASKQFLYDSVQQWNTGTHDGTYAASAGNLSNFMDRLSYTLAQPKPESLGTCIGSNNVVHACAVFFNSDGTSSVPNAINYTKYAVNGAVTTETPISYPSTTSGDTAPNYSNIAVAPNGNVGISFIKNKTASTFDIMYMERGQVGTASFVSGNNTVTGSGTDWLTTLNAGAKFKKATDGTFATVLTVNSNTSVTLTAPYAGTTESGVAFVSWQAPVVLQSVANNSGGSSTNVRFALNDPRVLSVNDTQVVVFARTTGTFTAMPVFTYGNSLLAAGRIGTVSLHVSNAGVDVAAVYRSKNLSSSLTSMQGFYSSDGGTTYTTGMNTSFQSENSDSIQVAKNGAGQFVVAYVDGFDFRFKKYNMTTNSTTMNPATLIPRFGGFVIYDNNEYSMEISDASGSGPTYLERYYFLTSSTIADTFGKIIPARSTRGMDNAGAVFNTIALGSSTGEIVIRRLSFSSTWTSAIGSDSTLSSWGTYDVTGQTNNGATIVHKVALGATSTLGAPAVITSGSVVTTDTSKTFYQVTITILITSLSVATIDSVVLNYFGEGVDAKFATGFVFDNEIYLAASRTGATANDVVVFLDRRSAWGMWFPRLSAMARMNTNFYGGSSTNGNVYKLKQGFSFAGSAYSLTAVTKEDFLGSLELDKEVGVVYVKFIVKTSGTFTFSYRINNYKSQTEVPWVDQVIDQTKDGKVEVPVKQTCSSIQFKVSQNDKDVELAFTGFVIMYGYLNVRG